MCTHLQSLGLSLSLCRAVPEPGAGWADGSPSNDNKVIDYDDLLGSVFASNNIASCWWLTSSTSFLKTNKQTKTSKKHLQYFFVWRFCWLTLESGRVCGNSPNTGGSESGLLQPADKHHTPPSCSAAPHLSTKAQEMNAEINPGLSQKKKSSNGDITWFLGTFVGTVAADRDAEESEEKKETSARELLVLAFVCSDLTGRSCRTSWAKLFGGFGGTNIRYKLSKHVDLLYFLRFFSFHRVVMTPATLPRTTNGYKKMNQTSRIFVCWTKKLPTKMLL